MQKLITTWGKSDQSLIKQSEQENPAMSYTPDRVSGSNSTKCRWTKGGIIIHFSSLKSCCPRKLWLLCVGWLQTPVKCNKETAAQWLEAQQHLNGGRKFKGGTRQRENCPTWRRMKQPRKQDTCKTNRGPHQAVCTHLHAQPPQHSLMENIFPMRKYQCQRSKTLPENINSVIKQLL